MKTKQTLGIASSHISKKWGMGIDCLNYETKELLEWGGDIFGASMLINPKKVSYSYINDRLKPVILHEGTPLAHINCLVVRGTSSIAEPVAALAHSLAITGSAVLDPMSRFCGGTPGKLLTTIDRFDKKNGSSSFVSFNWDGSFQDSLWFGEQVGYPLIAKPMTGSKGRGVVSLESQQDMTEYLGRHFLQSPETPVLLQKKEEIVMEFRVLIASGQSLGVVSKRGSAGSITANKATGGVFKKENRKDVEQYVVDQVSGEGILGVDVCETADGSFRIIEANRAPAWQEFDRASGGRVAERIVKIAHSLCQMEEDVNDSGFRREPM